MATVGILPDLISLLTSLTASVLELVSSFKHLKFGQLLKFSNVSQQA